VAIDRRADEARRCGAICIIKLLRGRRPHAGRALLPRDVELAKIKRPRAQT
jgi:hypothetical protein